MKQASPHRPRFLLNYLLAALSKVYLWVRALLAQSQRRLPRAPKEGSSSWNTDLSPRSTPFSLLLDIHCRLHPDATFAILPPPSELPDDDPTRPLPRVTWQQLKHAVDTAAHSIIPLSPVGTPTLSGKVIGIVAATDTLLYLSITLAIVRSGNIAFPISHRNTRAGVANLLRKTDCHHVVTCGSPITSSLLKDTLHDLSDLSHGHVNLIHIPSALEMFPHLQDKPPVSELVAYPSPTDDVNSLDSLRIYIHTSGTTGLPKPVPLDERYMRYMGTSTMARDLAKVELIAAFPLPPFHILGALLQLAVPLCTGAPIALWAPSLSTPPLPPPIPTPQSIMATLKRSGCTACMTVPAFLVPWSKDDSSVEFLRTLRYLMVGGGPTPQEVGDSLVRRGVYFLSAYGSSECCGPARSTPLLREPHEWYWMEFDPEMPIRFVKHDQGDGRNLYEFQMGVNELFRPAAINTETPDGPAFSSGDLFEAHPTKPGLWKIVGRLDEQFQLAIGEKVNPAPIESILLQDPMIQGVMLVGHARNQVAAIIEPAPTLRLDVNDEAALAVFRNRIWHTVDLVNQKSPKYHHIFKEAIIVTSPDRPLPRTLKGTIQRRVALDLYARDIDKLYDAIDSAQNAGSDAPPPSWSAEDLREWLLGCLNELVDQPISDPDVDIFNCGADSLTATFLRNRIIGAARKSRAKSSLPPITLDQNIVFAYSTISALAAHIADIMGESSSSGSTANAIHDMETLVKRYTTDIERTTPSAASPTRPSAETILLTGTTGALGSITLAKLLVDDRVEHIWAVNRSSPGDLLPKERQRQSFTLKGLDTELLDTHGEKLTFVEADLCDKQLGLDTETFEKIHSSTTTVIHNAWQLNFNLSVKSFEPLINGTRNLVDFALASPHHPHLRFFFLSTIGALTGWKDLDTPIPEEPLRDPSISAQLGYGASKYVGEKIIEAAAEKSGLQGTVVRIGQLCGAQPSGFWSPTDWFPILLKTSLELGCLPNTTGHVSWVPLDQAAAILLDVVLSSDPHQQVLHIHHTQPTPWTTMMQTIAQEYPSVGGAPFPLVPFATWVTELETRIAEDVNRFPALKLLPFFQHLAEGDRVGSTGTREALISINMSTLKMQKVSAALREIEPLDTEDFRSWVAYMLPQHSGVGGKDTLYPMHR